MGGGGCGTRWPSAYEDTSSLTGRRPSRPLPPLSYFKMTFGEKKVHVYVIHSKKHLVYENHCHSPGGGGGWPPAYKDTS